MNCRDIRVWQFFSFESEIRRENKLRRSDLGGKIYI